MMPRPKGDGVEPHYHDNDKIWFWATGRGEDDWTV
jgi:hypothetical protein